MSHEFTYSSRESGWGHGLASGLIRQPVAVIKEEKGRYFLPSGSAMVMVKRLLLNARLATRTRPGSEMRENENDGADAFMFPGTLYQ